MSVILLISGIIASLVKGFDYEEAHVNLADFSLEGGSKKGLRNIRNKIEKLGYRFEVLMPDQIPGFHVV